VAAGATDYSTWITLSPAAADYAVDAGSIITSTSTDSNALTTIAIGGTSAGSVAAYAFEPVDSDGNTVDLTTHDLIFRVDWGATGGVQPSAGSDIGLAFGVLGGTVPGTPANNWVTYGCHYDATGGPDLVYYAGTTWAFTGPTTADANAQLFVTSRAIQFDDASSRYEPWLGGEAAWFFEPSGSTWGPQEIKGNVQTNKDLGTVAGALRILMFVIEGSSAETIKCKIQYRVVPTIQESI
jgi:hypothetical protein